MRVAVGGLKHESNTFSPVPTEYADFYLARGEAALAGGLRDLAQGQGIELAPAFVARANPGGVVRQATYLRLREELLCALRATLPVDGVYLDLHGAMEVEGIGDGGGDLTTAVRALVGWEIPIAASLDLHGNISPALVHNVNALTAMRTAPHRDGQETRQRALAMLLRALREGRPLTSALVQLPLLLPGEAAMTTAEPARSLYARLPETLRRPGLVDASILVGCAWTDSPNSTASVIVVSEGHADLAWQEARELAGEVWARRREFVLGAEAAPLDEAIRRALASPERPVFLSDCGDNVTAGACGDIPLCAEHLIALGARDALVAGLADAEAVRQCVCAGVGAEVTLTVGGKLDTRNGRPLTFSGQVRHLACGPQDPPGQPGLATVAADGVTILLAADRRPFTDRASILQGGVDPMQQQLVVVKLGYLFPDLADHAPRVIMALTPGATDLDLARLPYRRIPRPVYPLDRDLTWAP